MKRILPTLDERSASLDDTTTRAFTITREGRARAHSSEEPRRSPERTVQPRLVALRTAVPPFSLGQPEVAERVRLLFSEVDGEAVERLMPIFGNAGIERRYSCVPIDWYVD